LIDGVHQGHDVGLGEAAAEVPFGGGVGEPLGVQGVEVNLVVASEFEVFDAFAAGEDIEGDVQDMVGFVIGEMPLEDMEVVVDVADQTSPARQEEHGADAARGEALNAIGEFVVDVVGGNHWPFALRSGPVLDAIEDPLPALTESSAVAFPGSLGVAFSGFLGDSRSHSKAPEGWNSEDVFSPPLFQILQGFSSFFRNIWPKKKILRLVQV
jgi:hypothetical protein